MTFADRVDAGRQLAELLVDCGGRGDVVIAGLPRGGVVVAATVAAELGATLDAVLVRKLGFPGHPELAMGAIALWGAHVEVVRNEYVLRRGRVDPAVFDDVLRRELDVLRRRAAAWDVGAAPLRGRIAVLVDDGAATGATVRAAVAAVRRAAPAKVVVGLPVASESARADLAALADAVRCVLVPRRFGSVGSAYRDFAQVDDDIVWRTLSNARAD
jgi:putative phosphoribosyl transferase